MRHDLTVSREYAAEHINAVVNHPDVRPWVGGKGVLDLSGIVADQNNVLLMGDGGGLVFVRLGDGLYEVHTQFVPEKRGLSAVQAVKDALYWMFTRTDCVDVVTKVPEGNDAALGLVRTIGGARRFHRDKAWETASGLVGCDYFGQTIEDWVRHEGRLLELGAWFHDKLETAKRARGSTLPVHDDDPAHDRYVGATVAMIGAGQVLKGLAFYSRWAAFAGYGPISVIAGNPVVIDIGDAILAVRGHDYEVLLCR